MSINTSRQETPAISLEEVLAERFSEDEAKVWLKDHALAYRELMTYYKCAMMEVETKFKVLNEDLSLRGEGNPIESIKTRLKSPDSLVDKMIRYELPITIEAMEESIFDVAGVRAICSFESDIYKLADAILQQDDVTLINRKDYIESPKKNGYRSLHLILAVPIFLHNQKRVMNVEVQLRTLSMDLWASLEHKLRYKKDVKDYEPHLSQELKRCADMTKEIDARMEQLHRMIDMNMDYPLE